MTPHSSIAARFAAARPAAALAAVAMAVFAPAQAITYTARNGGNIAYCGLPGAGPLVQHQFSTPVSNSDSIAVVDPGGSFWPATSASAQFDATATPAGISLAVTGSGMRTASPLGGAYAVADGRDYWEFTVAAPTRFTLNGTLSASSTEPTMPQQHFTFGALVVGNFIVPDPGSTPPPYQRTLTAPGMQSMTGSGILMPGSYSITFFGRAEGAANPWSGSYAHALTITFEPAANATSRPASGNANSYTCDLPLLGQTWHATVDVGATGHTLAIVFAAPAPATVPLGPGLTVLLGGPIAEFLPLAAGPQAAYAFAMPANPTLAGLFLSTQALHFGGAPSLLLSNAQDLTLGF